MNNAPAMTTKTRDGQLVYVLHGCLEVNTLDLAIELLTDGRETCRSMPDANQRMPVDLVGNGVAPRGRGALVNFPWEI